MDTVCIRDATDYLVSCERPARLLRLFEFGHNGPKARPAGQTGISCAFLTNTFSMPRNDRIIELSTLANECVRAERG